MSENYNQRQNPLDRRFDNSEYGGFVASLVQQLWRETMDAKERIAALETSTRSANTTIVQANNKDYECLKVENDELHIKVVELEKTLESVQSARNNNTENELLKIKRKYDELQTRFSELQNKLKKSQAEAEELRNRPTNTQDMENLQNLVDKKSQTIAELERKNDEISKENAELYKIAYTDSKTRTMNTRAFNRDFGKKDLGTMAFAIFNICNTKHINDTKGRKTGDNVIRAVANMLSEAFGNENVYRVMGDQFYVIHNDLMALNNTANAIINKCMAQNIFVIVGYGNGTNAKNYGDVLREAENNIRSIKMSRGNNQQDNYSVQNTMQNNNYNNAPADAPQYNTHEYTHTPQPESNSAAERRPSIMDRYNKNQTVEEVQVGYEAENIDDEDDIDDEAVANEMNFNEGF